MCVFLLKKKLISNNTSISGPYSTSCQNEWYSAPIYLCVFRPTGSFTGLNLPCQQQVVARHQWLQLRPCLWRLQPWLPIALAASPCSASSCG